MKQWTFWYVFVCMPLEKNIAEFIDKIGTIFEIESVINCIISCIYYVNKKMNLSDLISSKFVDELNFELNHNIYKFSTYDTIIVINGLLYVIEST